MNEAAARHRSTDDLRLDTEESGARPIWKHLDELEGGTPPPLDARERADVDALLREIGAMPNPELQPPVVPSAAGRSHSGRRLLGLPAVMLTVLGAVAFLFGLFVTMAALEWNRAEARAETTGKVVADDKSVVVLQLPPFTITARVPSEASPREADALGEAPATAAAAAWRPPQLAPDDAPPRVTPMAVDAPSEEPVALSEATDAELDAVIAGLAAPAPRETLDAPRARQEPQAMYTPAIPASMPGR